MTTTASTVPAPPAARRPNRALRITGALVFLAIGAIATVYNDAYRSFEAALAAVTLAPVVATSGSSSDTYFVVVDNGMIGLQITPECTALILLVPLIVIAGILLVFTRAAAWRIGAGVLAMYAVVTLVNEVRLALIAVATVEWGVDVGYPISHVYVGSVIGILGFVAGLAVLLIVAGTTRKRRR